MRCEGPLPDADGLARDPGTIRRVIRETHDTFTLFIRPTLPDTVRFEAGQYTLLRLPKVGESAVHCSGDPHNAADWVHTIRATDPVTAALGRLRAGATVEVAGPFGSAWPVDAARGRDLILMAGGIGLSALRPVIYDVLSRRQEFGKTYLFYGTRTPLDLLYARELSNWSARRDLHVGVTVDQAGSDWNGTVGAITRLLDGLDCTPQRSVAMVCGPAVMMRFSLRELRRHRLAPDDVFFMSGLRLLNGSELLEYIGCQTDTSGQHPRDTLIPKSTSALNGHNGAEDL